MGVAAIAGGIALATIALGYPLLALAGFFGQGVVVVCGLSLAYRSARLQHRSLALTAAMATALAAVLAFYSGLWMREAWHCRQLVGAPGARGWLQLMGVGFTTPYRALDTVLVAKTGHGGLIGYILYRLLGHGPLLALTIGQFAATALVCVLFARKWTPGAVCPICVEWLGEGRNAAIVPAWKAGELAAGISTGDVDRVLAAVCGSADANLAGRYALGRLWKCGNCGARLADLVIKAHGAQPTRVLPPTVVDEQLAIALKTDTIADAAVTPPPPQDVTPKDQAGCGRTESGPG
jgi:hypothetical protein